MKLFFDNFALTLGVSGDPDVTFRCSMQGEERVFEHRRGEGEWVAGYPPSYPPWPGPVKLVLYQGPDIVESEGKLYRNPDQKVVAEIETNSTTLVHLMNHLFRAYPGMLQAELDKQNKSAANETP